MSNESSQTGQLLNSDRKSGHAWCVGICDYMFVPKFFTDLLFVSLQFLRPLFSDLLIGGLPPNSCQHHDNKKMQAEDPPQIGDYAGTQGLGLLRLHSTYRHDLKIYASDEGMVNLLK